MTPEEAIRILDAAVAQMAATRAEHEKYMEALDILRAVVEGATAQADTEERDIRALVQ